MKSFNHSPVNEILEINHQLLNTLAAVGSKELDVIAQQFEVGLNGYVTVSHSMMVNVNRCEYDPHILLRAMEQSTQLLITLSAVPGLFVLQSLLGFTYPQSNVKKPTSVSPKRLTKPLAEPTAEDSAAEVGLRLENCL